MFNQDDFLAYLGMDGNTNNQKPVQQRAPRKSAPKPSTRPLPAVSTTFVSPNGLLTAQPVRAVVPAKEVVTTPIVPAPAPASTVTDIEMVPYSAKSFAIYGNTRPIQKQLEDLGGSFNRWLKRDGVATPGYIFSNKREDAVRKTLNL